MSKRGIKSVNGRKPRKLSTHAEDDQARRRGRVNLTIAQVTRERLAEMGYTKTKKDEKGQSSTNVEFGVYLIHFLTHGGNVDGMAFDLVEFCGDVARFKQDGSAYGRMSNLVAYLDALTKATRKVVSSRGEMIGDGGIKLTKPNA